MKSLILCVKQTHSFSCRALNSGPNKDVSRMKAVVAAENTEHTAGFSSHSDCVVLAPSCAFAS